MYTLSGFVTSTTFNNNTPGVVSPICELAQRSTTFTRELGIYGLPQYSSVRLMTFESKEDDVEVAVNPTRTELLLELSQWLVERSIAGTLSDDEEVCRLAIVAEFGDRLTVDDVGAMVQSGIYWMPSSLTFQLVAGGANNIRLWFSDAALRAQYDGYAHLVVSPIDDLDLFHSSPATIIPIIADIKFSDLTTRVDTAAGGKPYTILWSREYDWVDKNDPDNRRPVPWSVIVYGQAGINEDLIKISLQDYILANSSYTREEWEVVFPDIFLPTEFYIVPFWNQYSLPEGLQLSGLYSPVVKHSEVIPYALIAMPGYTEEHLSDFICTTTNPWKSVAFMACGHPRNRNGIQDFRLMWPEYAAIGTMHQDFNRMSPSTQNFIALLMRMFMLSESMDPFSDIPEGMSKVERNSIWFLSTTYENVQYLVPWKSNPELTTP